VIRRRRSRFIIPFFLCFNNFFKGQYLSKFSLSFTFPCASVCETTVVIDPSSVFSFRPLLILFLVDLHRDLSSLEEIQREKNLMV